MPLDDLSQSGDALSACLSAEERQRAGQFLLAGARHRFVAARAASRILLGRLLAIPPADVPICLDRRGKPRLPSRLLSGERISNTATDHGPPAQSRTSQPAQLDLHFNLSHSGELALIAIALGCEVGVDVEQLREVERCEQIARRYFHEAEATALSSTDSSRRHVAFLRCWTGKEAVLKALGVGFRTALDRFAVPVGEHEGKWTDVAMTDCSPSTTARCWLVPLVPHVDYVGAVACVNERRRVACRSLRL